MRSELNGEKCQPVGSRPRTVIIATGKPMITPMDKRCGNCRWWWIRKWVSNDREHLDRWGWCLYPVPMWVSHGRDGETLAEERADYCEGWRDKEGQ